MRWYTWLSAHINMGKDQADIQVWTPTSQMQDVCMLHVAFSLSLSVSLVLSVLSN